MCEPMTIAAVGVGAASLVGAGIGAYGEYKQGQSAAKQADYNAKLAGYQASDAVNQGNQQAGQIKADASRTMADAQAATAGNGVDANTGSPANLFTASAVNAGIAADRVKANAARQAWGFQQEAKDLRAKSNDARQAGILGALGTGLSGIGSAAGAFSGMTK